MVSMAAITMISENFHERSFISMAEDLWTLPFLVALRTLPSNANPWIFYVSSMSLLSVSLDIDSLHSNNSHYPAFFLCILTRIPSKSVGAPEMLELSPAGRSARPCTTCKHRPFHLKVVDHNEAFQVRPGFFYYLFEHLPCR